MKFDYVALAKMFDHAFLRPTETDDVMEAGCRQAREYGVASVCIKPYGVRLCADVLAGSDVLTSTVIGFPHGSNLTDIKLAEIDAAIEDGAEELDVVVNVGKVLQGDWDFVEADIGAMTELCHESGKLIKVIFENCYLDDERKVQLCKLCTEIGVDFVKTSTGFGTGGATVDDVKLMRANCPDHIRVKASGGVKTLDDLLAMREAGAARVGSSSTFAILDDVKARG